MKHTDILIVDDEQRYAGMLAKRLSLRGLSCEVRYNGSSAIAVGDDGGVWTGGPRLSRVDFGNLTVDEELHDVEVIGNGTQVWISGAQGVLVHRDSSLEWSKPESRTTLLLPKVEFLSESEGYAAGSTFTILKYE